MTCDEYKAEVKRLNAIEARAQKRLEKAQEEARQLTLKYLLEHPLKRGEIELLRERVKAGDPMCCDGGRIWLESALSDEVWIALLNRWSYERLGGCHAPRDYHPMWLRNLDEAVNNVELFLDG